MSTAKKVTDHTLNYIIQKDLLTKLKQRGDATFTKASFIDAVNRGVVPYYKFDGFSKKHYVYEEVAQALKSAGIGKPLSTQDKLATLPDPKPNQTEEEYGDEIKDLTSSATITDANIFKVIWQGKTEKLKYEKEEGLLISRSEVENKAFNVARSIRDKILSIPERMSNELASIDDPHMIKELLYKEFNVLLDGFSKDSFI